MSDVDLGNAAAAWLLVGGGLSGAASMWAFRRWADTQKLNVSINRILAHLLEFRLFADEPALLLRAQWNLLKSNGTMLHLLLRPSILLLIPFGIMLAVMDGFFARAALPLGEQSVVTMQHRGALQSTQLVVPPGIRLETPPVRVIRERQVSWGIRASSRTSGSLQVLSNGRTIQKAISAGPGLHWISEERSKSPFAFALHPQELPLTSSDVDWVRVQYPKASVFGFHWLVWYSAAACLGAVLTFWRASRA